MKNALLLFFILIGSAFAGKGPSLNGPYWHDFDFVNQRGKSIVYLPNDYNPKKKYPLLISLHGFAAGANLQNSIFDFRQLTTEMQFILINPDGLKGAGGVKFWNATDFCCNYGKIPVDDVDYMKDLIEGMSEEYSIDLKRVHFFGHSNGGFMNYRLACDAPELMASMASFAGVTWNDPNKCKGKEPVPVLQIHATDDFLIQYKGTSKYPGALETVKFWADHNNCNKGIESQQSFNDLKPLNLKVPYLTTNEKVWGGCDNDASVSFWSVDGGDHLMRFNEKYLRRIVKHLFKYSKK